MFHVSRLKLKEFLKEERIRRNMPQIEFAKLFKVNQQQMSNWEKGRFSKHARPVWKLCERIMLVLALSEKELEEQVGSLGDDQQDIIFALLNLFQKIAPSPLLLNLDVHAVQLLLEAEGALRKSNIEMTPELASALLASKTPPTTP